MTLREWEVTFVVICQGDDIDEAIWSARNTIAREDYEPHSVEEIVND